MTIKSDKRREGYQGTGGTDTFSYGFKVFQATDFVIQERITAAESGFSIGDVVPQTVGAIGSGADYEVNGVKNKNGGQFIRALGNLPTTRFVAAVLSPAFIQDTSIRNQKVGLRGRIEDELDRSRQIDLFLLDILQRCLKVGASVDPSVVNTEMPTPAALKFWRWNATATGIDAVDIGSLGAIGLPGSNGLAVYLGSNNFTSRILQGINGITVTNGDGVSANPTVSGQPLQDQIDTNDTDISDLQTRTGVLEEQFICSEQSTPDDTVFVTAGQVNDPSDKTAKPVDVAADAASAVTFPVTTPANSRIDLLVQDLITGVLSRVAGVDAGSPTVPAYPTDKRVRCEVTITDTVTVVINDADIRNVKSYLDYTQFDLLFATGTYTGDGNATQVIGSLPFQPKIVRIYGGSGVTANQGAFTRNDTHTGADSFAFGVGLVLTNCITVIAATSFTVANNANINANTSSYTFEIWG